MDKDRKPYIPVEGAPAFRIRPEDLAEFRRIAAENWLDPRLWEMSIPLFGYEDEQPPKTPDAPEPDKPKT